MSVQVPEKTIPLSLKAILVSMLALACLILLGSFAYCWGFGKYTVRQATDVVFAAGWILFWIGLAVWYPRVFQLARATSFFRQFSAYDIDRVNYTPKQRFFAMVFNENGLAISVFLAGLFIIFLSVLFGKLLSDYFPPHAVIRFLVRPDIWYEIKNSKPLVIP